MAGKITKKEAQNMAGKILKHADKYGIPKKKKWTSYKTKLVSMLYYPPLKQNWILNRALLYAASFLVMKTNGEPPIS